MLKINYTPNEYNFTPDLPTEISIATDHSSIDITVECDGETALNTCLYSYNNTATLYNIHSVIENYMFLRNKIFTQFVILTDSDSENDNIKESSVIFSRLNIGHNHASAYIQSFFLTTLSSFTKPRKAYQHLINLALPGCTIQCHIECLVLVDGESTPRTIRL